MDVAVPDYIFASGLSAQQARHKRTSLRPTSPPASPRAHAPSNSQDLDIKTVSANPCGNTIAFDNALMSLKWRVFSRESETYTNCVLMRRSSYCSLEMRVWRLLSLGTWFDANTLRSGVTLGSLGIQNRGPPSIPASHSVVIRTREFDPADCVGEDADLADMPGHSRKATNLTSQSKADLLRHKDILQCPWNALAMLFFYKWHVLKESPPNFEDPAWADQPLFHIDPALYDDELEQFCGDIYAEFVEGASRGVQRFKYTTESALEAITDALTSSKLLRNAVSTAQNMYVTQRSLQNGHCADVQLANAGFGSEKRATTYNVPRHKHAVPQHIEEQIFPFVDDLPRCDELADLGGSPELWDTIVRFCNMLKVLRTALLQDMAILCDIPFYRRMLRGTAIFSSDVFQSIHFVKGADKIRKHSWIFDFLPLVENTPRDIKLAYVVPCTAFVSSDKNLTDTDAAISQIPNAETPALVELIGGSPKADLHNSKTACMESPQSELLDVVLPSTEVSSAELPAAESPVMATNTGPGPSSADLLPGVEQSVPEPSSADPFPSAKSAVPVPSSVDALPIKRKLPSSELNNGAAPPHPRLDAENQPIFDAVTVKRKLDSIQSDDCVPPPKRHHVYDLSSSNETLATPISNPYFVDLTLDSDDDDDDDYDDDNDDDNDMGSQAQIQDMAGMESSQLLDKSSIVLVNHLEELAVLPIDQAENQTQDQEVEESCDTTTTVQTPVSSTFSAEDTAQTVSKPLESILTVAELSFAAEIDGRCNALSESADTSDTRRDSSCTSSGGKSDDSSIRDEKLTDESDLRKKAALADKLLQSIREISSELSEAVTINQSMHRKISRITTRQKYPGSSTVNGKTSTQLPTGSSGSNDRLRRSLGKLEMAAMRNNDCVKNAANTAARILEEAEAEL
ncbi:hypothetical protein GGH96_001864 [Coemansia sp. RSA 1972]|nr:hypothetical protein GGH96_001864 [Coemansia sp. RSA 1972]